MTTPPATQIIIPPAPRSPLLVAVFFLALLGVAGLFYLAVRTLDDLDPVPSAPANAAPLVVTVVVAFPTDTPTPAPTATRTRAATNTPWPTRPTCVTPVPNQGCTNRELPTAVPTPTPKPPESFCEDIDLWIRKDQDCHWRPLEEATPTPTMPAPTSAPLPGMEER